MLQIKLKRLREEHKLSQAKLAEAIGVSQSTVGMWESGKNTPEYSNLVKIADVFNIPLSELFDEEGTKKEPAEGRLERSIGDDDLRFALFGGDAGIITDEMLDEVKRFAKFIVAKEKDKQNEGENS